MAVTPNYSWPIPVATDLVKDGYAAIADLGDAIDATVFGLGASALTLIKTQTIGSAVSSVNITSAFSATYDNYLVTISGGVGSTTCYLRLALGAQVTSYYGGAMGALYNGGTFAGIGDNNAAQFSTIGWAATNAMNSTIFISSPNLAKVTAISASLAVAGSVAYSYVGQTNTTTQFTDFTITPSTGTLTGGTIRVYGYKN